MAAYLKELPSNVNLRSVAKMMNFNKPSNKFFMKLDLGLLTISSNIPKPLSLRLNENTIAA